MNHRAFLFEVGQPNGVHNYYVRIKNTEFKKLLIMAQSFNLGIPEKSLKKYIFCHTIYYILLDRESKIEISYAIISYFLFIIINE